MGLQETEPRSDEFSKIPKKQSVRALWKPMNQQETVWNRLYRKITKITSQQGIRFDKHITTWCTRLFQCLKRSKFWMRKQHWTRNGRSSTRFQLGRWTMLKSRKTRNGRSSTRFQPGSWTQLKAKRRLFWKHKETKKKVHFATLMDICHLTKS